MRADVHVCRSLEAYMVHEQHAYEVIVHVAAEALWAQVCATHCSPTRGTHVWVPSNWRAAARGITHDNQCMGTIVLFGTRLAQGQHVHARLARVTLGCNIIHQASFTSVCLVSGQLQA
jgi:hypothetical protein